MSAMMPMSFPMRGPITLRPLLRANKWIQNSQPLNLVPVLQVFAIQGAATAFDGGGDDQGVVEMVARFLDDKQRAIRC